MRIAALYDIHGNLPALEAVLADVRRQRVDRVVIGGDVVPGPLPRESLDCLSRLDVPVDLIQGNGEDAVLTLRAGREPAMVPPPYREGIRWVGQQMSDTDERWMASWPKTHALRVDDIGRVLFCHATPRSDTEVFTRDTPADRLLPIFDTGEASVVVCGHTHMQFDRMIGRTRVVNAGSVGMPFGEPGAYWLLLGPSVELRRTSYDLDLAAARIRTTSYPQAEDFAQNNVLRPPLEQAMREAFTRVELR